MDADERDSGNVGVTGAPILALSRAGSNGVIFPASDGEVGDVVDAGHVFIGEAP